MQYVSSILKKTKNYKNIFSNFSYLFVIQLLNLALPIVTYPYLLATLGKELYGKMVYAQAIIGYAVILINFGFNITATKEISIHRNDLDEVNRIVNSTYQVQGSLFVFSTIILSMFLWITGADQSTFSLYLLTMWMGLYEFLFPIWYFQGTENMKYITLCNALSRLLFLVLIFVLIKHPSNYLLVPAINGIGALISCAVALTIIYKRGIRFKWQPLSTLLACIKSSYVMAISVGANSFKTSFNVIIIKQFFNYSTVAYFDLALKITNIGIAFLDLISQSIYPQMSKTKDIGFLKKMLAYSVLASMAGLLAVEILCPVLVRILGGKNMNDAIVLLRILAFIFPIYIIGALLGRNCLVVFGHDASILTSMLYSSLFYIGGILIAYWLLALHNSLWIAVIFILSYLFETIYRYYKCKAYKLI